MMDASANTRRNQALPADFRFPASQSISSRAITQSQSSPPSSPNGAPDEPVNILLVDDTPENLVALEAVLGDLGQNLVKARSGEEALHLLLRYDFAAIILDVNMPGLNGFETAALIRQRKTFECTPIIFVSAISTTETHMCRGYALGAVDYISTPVVPDVLRSKIAVFVELLKRNKEVQRQAELLRQIEEEQHQRRLHEAAERLELQTKRNRFFNFSLDLLAIVGFDAVFKQFNPSWHRILGFSEEEFHQRSITEFIAPEDVALTNQWIQSARQSSGPVSFASRCISSDGSYRFIAWTFAPFPEEQLLYVFGRDVTEQKRAEQKIQKLNEDLERRAAELGAANQGLETEVQVRTKAEQALKETNAELESFSYSVSHDLRAPLRAMQAFAGALLEDYGSKLDETGQDFTRRIVSGAQRMERLIEDLLAYSRISHGELKLQPLSPESLLQECVAQLEVPLRDSRATLTIEQPLLPVLGHPPTLLQVLSNLLSNAIKFVTPNTAPTIRIRIEACGDMARLWVEDNGIGIEPQHHTRIFRVFERLHGIETYPGTGIGLAIVRKGVERMGGTFGLESAPNQGSKFWIELRRPSSKSTAD